MTQSKMILTTLTYYHRPIRFITTYPGDVFWLVLDDQDTFAPFFRPPDGPHRSLRQSLIADDVVWRDVSLMGDVVTLIPFDTLIQDILPMVEKAGDYELFDFISFCILEALPILSGQHLSAYPRIELDATTGDRLPQTTNPLPQTLASEGITTLDGAIERIEQMALTILSMREAAKDDARIIRTLRDTLSPPKVTSTSAPCGPGGGGQGGGHGQSAGLGVAPTAPGSGLVDVDGQGQGQGGSATKDKDRDNKDTPSPNPINKKQLRQKIKQGRMKADRIKRQKQFRKDKDKRKASRREMQIARRRIRCPNPEEQ